MKKFALVLSGGGFKGAFQVGALKYLKENWSKINASNATMKFDVITGVSVGSLNGVLTACNEFDELERLWRDLAHNVEEIYTSDIIDTKNQTNELKYNISLKKIKEWFLPDALNHNISLVKALPLFFSKQRRKEFLEELFRSIEKEFTKNFKSFRAIADNTPLKKRLESLVTIDKIKNAIFKCGFVSLNDGKYYAYKHSQFKTDKDFQSAILASTAMPIVWEPVPVIHTCDKTIYQSVDGGIVNVSPLADVIEEINHDDPHHEYTIFIVNCNSGEVAHKPYQNANIAHIGLRALNDIAITEIFNNDVSEFIRINDLIEQVKGLDPDANLYNYSVKEGRTTKVLRNFKAVIIQPDTGVLGDPLIANKALNDIRMQHGWAKAQEALTRQFYTPSTFTRNVA